MKVTDYSPRAAVFDTYLTETNLTGLEIGVDVGAHAEALLKYCSVKHLTLVDIWDKDYCRGYCEGRLVQYRPKIKLIKASAESFLDFSPRDFIYFDLPQTYELTKRMLKTWWPSVRPAGVLGYRGAKWPEVLKACKEFNPDCIVTDDDIIMIKR